LVPLLPRTRFLPLKLKLSPMSELEPIEARPAIRIPRQTEDRNETVVRFAPLSGILSGPIFTRTRDIIAANMTELLDRSEDPARMIHMIINEMEETLVEVRATAARSIADIKEMRRACNRLDDLQHGWTEKAELALEKGREDLARAALGEKQKAAEMAESLHAEVSQIEQVLRGYEADIQRLQVKLAEARARQNAIATRLESAMTRARTREVLHGSRTEEAFAKFELLERRADFAEGRADALALSGPKSLEEEIAELRGADAVSAELDAMKAALAARN
jgi:phage shock protein A